MHTQREHELHKEESQLEVEPATFLLPSNRADLLHHHAALIYAKNYFELKE